jgi:hypothetical protein
MEVRAVLEVLNECKFEAKEFPLCRNSSEDDLKRARILVDVHVNKKGKLWPT